MSSDQTVRPWKLRDGIARLAARMRVAGTIQFTNEEHTDSSTQRGCCNDVPLIGPGTLLVAAYLDSTLHDRGRSA